MSRLDDLHRGIDRQIAEALKKGKFDNLPGKGKPLPRGDQPHDSDTHLAHKILKDNDYLLPWMEKRQRIDQEFEQARDALRRSWDLYERSRDTPWGQDEWDKARARFDEAVVRINRLIRDHNLEIPTSRLEKFLIDPARELEKIQAA